MKVWLFNFRILFSKIFLPTLVTHSIKGDYLLLFTKGEEGLISWVVLEEGVFVYIGVIYTRACGKPLKLNAGIALLCEVCDEWLSLG